MLFRVCCAIGALSATIMGSAHAGPVSSSQTLQYQEVAAFGAFSVATTSLSGWSPVWPFTASSQVTSVVLSFSTLDQDFTDSALFPTGNGGGIPGVEIGYVEEGTATRVAIGSVSAASPIVTLTAAAGALYAGLVAALLDGNASFSLGAFVNYPNAQPAFSEPLVLGDLSTLTIRVAGTVPGGTVPEPSSLALAGLAIVAAGVAGSTRRRVKQQDRLPKCPQGD